VFDPTAHVAVRPESLRSQGKHTPFAFDCSAVELPVRVMATVVAGAIAYGSA